MLPECSQLPADLCETPRLLQHLPGEYLRPQVCGSRACELCRSRGLCTGLCCSGSGHLRGSVCAQVRSGSGLCPGSGHVCGSLCAQVRSGSGHVRCSLCRSLCRSGSGELRCSLCSGSGEVLRHRLLQDQVLQC